MEAGNVPPFRGGMASQYLYVGVMALFGLAVLIQIFFAGEAALIAPEDWQTHIAWIHMFQWLSIALPLTGFLASRRLDFAALNCAPLVIIGLQYVFIHRAINDDVPLLAGFHGVNGSLLFGFAVYTIQEWRHR